jgi:FKBP-type peptidyl-prolyl cis-trans isomerase
MKKIPVILFLFAISINLHARAIQEISESSGEKSRSSYAFGMIIGSEFTNSGLEIDYHSFIEGLKDVMENRTAKFSRDEAIEIVENSFQKAQTLRNEESRIKEMLFLSENGQRPGVITTASGLQYEILSEGKGVKPDAKDVVRVHYEGSFINGEVFDSSYTRGEPAEFPLNGVISGWSEGLQLMDTGSKYRLYIPSALAYGEMGAGAIIPPYSPLIFSIELLDIVSDENMTDDDFSSYSE